MLVCGYTDKYKLEINLTGDLMPTEQGQPVEKWYISIYDAQIKWADLSSSKKKWYDQSTEMEYLLPLFPSINDSIDQGHIMVW